jgi:hypothetical protein
MNYLAAKNCLPQERFLLHDPNVAIQIGDFGKVLAERYQVSQVIRRLKVVPC